MTLLKNVSFFGFRCCQQVSSLRTAFQLLVCVVIALKDGDFWVPKELWKVSVEEGCLFFHTAFAKPEFFCHFIPLLLFLTLNGFDL